FDRSGPECVRRTDQWRPARLLHVVRQFADRSGLARAIDADNHHHGRRRGVRRLAVRTVEDGTIENVRDLVLDQIAQALATARLFRRRRDDLTGRTDANVRADQNLFERVERVNRDRPAACLGRVSLSNNFLEALDDLRFGALKAFLEARKQAHRTRLYRPTGGSSRRRPLMMTPAVSRRSPRAADGA